GNGRGCGEPGGDRRIGRQVAVATRGEGAARADLGGVGDTVALELVGEEALEENEEPAPDLPHRVAPAEGVQRHARDAPRAKAEAQEVVEEEVVQLVGADQLLRALRDLAAGAEA